MYKHVLPGSAVRFISRAVHLPHLPCTLLRALYTLIHVQHTHNVCVAIFALPRAPWTIGTRVHCLPQFKGIRTRTDAATCAIHTIRLGHPRLLLATSNPYPPFPTYQVPPPAYQLPTYYFRRATYISPTSYNLRSPTKIPARPLGKKNKQNTQNGDIKNCRGVVWTWHQSRAFNWVRSSLASDRQRDGRLSSRGNRYFLH